MFQRKKNNAMWVSSTRGRLNCRLMADNCELIHHLTLRRRVLTGRLLGMQQPYKPKHYFTSFLLHFYFRGRQKGPQEGPRGFTYSTSRFQYWVGNIRKIVWFIFLHKVYNLYYNTQVISFQCYTVGKKSHAEIVHLIIYRFLRWWNMLTC